MSSFAGRPGQGPDQPFPRRVSWPRQGDPRALRDPAAGLSQAGVPAAIGYGGGKSTSASLCRASRSE